LGKIKIVIILTICSIFLLLGCNKKLDENTQENITIDIHNGVVSKTDEEDNFYNDKNIVNEKEENNIEKDTKRLENENRKIIVIDPGHSSVGNPEKEPISPNSSKTKAKDVLGATGNYTNIPEHKTTVNIGLLLKDELIDRGYNVVMTKSEVDESLSNI